MAAKIYIARHGQNKDNFDGILNGHRDLPLTDLGREQAAELGRGILAAGLKFDAVYASPLIRALETAQIVCTTLGSGLKPVVLPELIERDFGVMSGQPISKIEALCAPEVIKTDTITYFLNPEGAETFPDLVKRGQKVLDIVRQVQHEGNVLLVCHGDLGKMIYAAATGTPWKDVLMGFHFGNGELIQLDPNNEVHLIKIAQHNL